MFDLGIKGITRFPHARPFAATAQYPEACGKTVHVVTMTDGSTVELLARDPSDAMERAPSRRRAWLVEFRDETAAIVLEDGVVLAPVRDSGSALH